MATPQSKAIHATYEDREKLVKPIRTQMKLAKLSSGKGSIPKPKIATGITPPRFGRRAYYGEASNWK